MNEQYFRREFLKISGVPEFLTDKDPEEKVLNLYEKIDAEVHRDNVEACNLIKCNAGPKMIIIKMSRRTDADNIRMAQEKLKGLDLSSIDMNSVMFINDSLCRYYKNLWTRCKKLQLNKFIHGFWTSHGS